MSTAGTSPAPPRRSPGRSRRWALALARRGELVRTVAATRIGERLEHFDDGGLNAGADVDRPVDDPPRSEDGVRGQASGDDVIDVDVVAGLAAVAEDGRGSAVEDAPAEDRDDAGLPVGILPRAVDVSEAERGTGNRVQTLEGGDVALRGELAGAVGVSGSTKSSRNGSGCSSPSPQTAPPVAEKTERQPGTLRAISVR